MRRSWILIVAALMVAALALPGRAEEAQKPWFSGKTTVYDDTFNGYKIGVPEEMPLKEKGVSTNWMFQPEGSAAVEIHVTVTPMVGVPSIVLYETNLKTKKQDRNYKDVVALPVGKLGKKPVYAFRVSEADHKEGMADAKDPGDVHRVFLYVFGQDRQYLVQCNAPYSAFKDKKVQAAFDAALKSFGLIPLK